MPQLQKRNAWIVVWISMVLPSLVTWVYFIALSGESALAGGIGKLLQFGFPVVWLLAMRRLAADGSAAAATSTSSGTETAGTSADRSTLMPPSPLRLPVIEGAQAKWTLQLNLGFAVAMGCGVALLMVGYYHLAIPQELLDQFGGQVADRVEKLNLKSVYGFLLLGVFYAMLHSLMEEYYFRWFVFGQLRQLLSFVPAACLCGLSFMAHHVIVLSVYFGPSFHTCFLSLCIGVGGFIWAWQYEQSQNLYGCWLGHAIVDAAIFAIGYDLIFSRV